MITPYHVREQSTTQVGSDSRPGSASHRSLGISGTFLDTKAACFTSAKYSLEVGLRANRWVSVPHEMQREREAANPDTYYGSTDRGPSADFSGNLTSPQHGASWIIYHKRNFLSPGLSSSLFGAEQKVSRWLLISTCEDCSRASQCCKNTPADRVPGVFISSGKSEVRLLR